MKEKMDAIKSELFEYVKENTFKETNSLRSDTKLFVEGIFDSMGFALSLTTWRPNSKSLPRTAIWLRRISNPLMP